MKLKKSFLLICLAMTAIIIGGTYVFGELQSPGTGRWTTQTNITFVWNFSNTSGTILRVNESYNCTLYWNDTGAAHQLWYKNSSTKSNAGGLSGANDTNQSQTFYANRTLLQNSTGVSWNVTCRNGTYDGGANAGEGAESYGPFVVYIDTAAPVIDWSTMSANGTDYAGAITINVSINDTGTGINASYNVHSNQVNTSGGGGYAANFSHAYLAVMNNTGVWVFNATLNATNGTSTPPLATATTNTTGRVAYTINIAAWRDGPYTVYVYANDTLTATNTSSVDNMLISSYYFDVNNDAPTTPTFACSKSNPNQNEVITCTCLSTDEDGNVSITYNPYPSTVDLGAHTVTCNSSDGTNSSASAYTYTVYAGSGSSTGGGGGGGTGGGGAEVPSGGAAVETLTSIVASTPVTMTIAESAAVAVKEVTITTTEDVGSSKVTVTSKGASAPSGVSAPSHGTAYQYIEISATNIADKIKSADITFKVEKSWVTTNNIDPATVKLQRYADSTWNALETSKVSEDASAITYKATTTGFSVFAITGEKAAGAESGAGQQLTDLGAQAGKSWYWIVLIIVLIGVGYWYYTSYYKKKK